MLMVMPAYQVTSTAAPPSATGAAGIGAWPESERLLLARELHDVVSHTIAAIALQAGVALQLLGDAPERAAESLHAIRATSRDALHDLGALLATLREPDHDRESHDLAFPSRLARLVEQTTAAGVPTRLEVSGVMRPLPAATARALSRVVQESLTNVLRHSGAGSVTVSVAYGDEIAVDVVDDGAGAAAGTSPGSGLGILGMRERLAALGGSLDIGQLAERGFRVSARVPNR
jgi:signal transduction histidine kinase